MLKATPGLRSGFIMVRYCVSGLVLEDVVAEVVSAEFADEVDVLSYV